MMSLEISTLNDLIKYGFFAGLAYAYVTQTRRDLNGIGKKQRDNEFKAERRWKHQIATAIENARNLDEAKIIAALLRQDAWRD